MLCGVVSSLAVSNFCFCLQGLEEASRLYFGESNVEGMLATLLPLHDMVRNSNASTLKEIAFVQSYGRCAHPVNAHHLVTLIL